MMIISLLLTSNFCKNPQLIFQRLLKSYFQYTQIQIMLVNYEWYKSIYKNVDYCCTIYIYLQR